MRIIYFVIFTVSFFGLLQVIFFRLFHKAWWQKKWLRRSAWGLPLFGIIGLSMWGLGEYNRIDLITFPGATIAVAAFIFEIALVITLPFSGLIRLGNYFMERFSGTRKVAPEPVDERRRQILLSTAAALPLIALSGGAAGMIRAQAGVNVYLRPIAVHNLPPELLGMRILHLSDIHLRHYVTLSDLEQVLANASMFNPELVLVTGDIADDLAKLPDAIKLIEQLHPPLGSYACMGNHEYFRGPEEVVRIFDRFETPLFINQGMTRYRNNRAFFLGGIDDPRHMGAKDTDFFKSTLDKTMVDSPSETFSIMMSHRPDALDYGSEIGLNLILAGHTHGGQIGTGHRSLFEPIWPDRYLWGEYPLGKTILYTSSGVGHWFPFRLGCPPEAPVLELTSA